MASEKRQSHLHIQRYRPGHYRLGRQNNVVRINSARVHVLLVLLSHVQQ